ncbi:hypothetical protein [Geoglobus acetivorans]|uniref:Uncharacterized protein n=1 Tax=Geoglobus acetivorans TaxID=565033 RepID=A0ABZ3H163_GEOAI|nr:hypothetical protein [Geoglobus acetivorans]
MKKGEISEEEIQKILENLKNVIPKGSSRKSKDNIITCPICNRKGILRLVKKGRNYRFHIEHWIVYGSDPDFLTLRQRTDKCPITFHDEELFKEVLKIYMERFELSHNFRKWLEFYGFL